MKLKDIRALLASGDPIQILVHNGRKRSWQTIKENLNVSFLSAASHYRRKPKTRLRPWRPNEVPIGALFTWDNASEVYHIFEAGIRSFFYRKGLLGKIHAVFYHDAITSLYGIDYKYSIDNGITWSPCGVEEEIG